MENGLVEQELAELMRAVILKAIDDLRNGGEYAEDAKMFFLEYHLDDPYSHPFSFTSICTYLGLNAEMLRARIFQCLENNHRVSTRRRHTDQ
ncbi:MAG: hypothetical protein N2654_00940 [Deltaproteobacteria bacterium]|nr:hypothetical protein [Deltaproteobacteria bacterium]